MGIRKVVFALSSILLLATLSGCAGFGRKGGAGTPGDTVSDLYPELLEGDLAMVGERFDLTRERMEDAKFENVLFGYDSFQLLPSEIAKIETVGEYMRASPSVVLVIEGHCDERGSKEYNLSLGEYRALAVRAYLVSFGISPDRIQTASFGAEVPVAMGRNESAWRLNRRGEFVFYR